MKISTTLTHKEHRLITALPVTQAQEAMRMMTEHKIGYLVVCDSDGAVAGVLSERDIIRALVEGKSIVDLSAKDLMTTNPITCTPNDRALDILRAMNSYGFRHMPVIEDGKLKGVVSNRDILKSLFSQANHTIVESLAELNMSW